MRGTGIAKTSIPRSRSGAPTTRWSGLHGERADVEYLRILHLAATAGEARVVEVLAAVLDQVGGFDYVTVQAQVAPPVLTVPVIHIPAPDLSVYDALRAGAAA